MDDSSIIVNLDKSIRITQTNAMDKLSVWPRNIDLCITRMPIRKRDGYNLEFVNDFSKKLKPCMVKNGMVFLVCYSPSEDKTRPFQIVQSMIAEGFYLRDIIVIEKSWFPGKRSTNSLVNSYDYVLWFSMSDQFSIDVEPIKKYMMLEKEADLGNIWYCSSSSLDESISPDLCELLVRFSSLLPGSAIFDPMMGNMGMLKACLKLGHSLYGFDTDLRKLKAYKKIIEEFKDFSKE